MPDELVLIGEFARRTDLSPKALRRYDELGLLCPVRVDEATGYRWYAAEQVPQARLVSMLRRIDMPLSDIALVLPLAGPDAAAAVRRFWAGVEQSTARRSAAVSYLCQLLERGDPPVSAPRPVGIRAVPARTLLTSTRYVHEAEAGTVLGAALVAMRSAGAGLPGVDGCPFMTYLGEVSADSDGPIEISRPLADAVAAERAAAESSTLAVRHEDAHDEAFVRLTMAETRWPGERAALGALEAHLGSIDRRPAGPPRHIMIADWRTAADDEPASLLAVPLVPAAVVEEPAGRVRP